MQICFLPKVSVPCCNIINYTIKDFSICGVGCIFNNSNPRKLSCSQILLIKTHTIKPLTQLLHPIYTDTIRQIECLYLYGFTLTAIIPFLLFHIYLDINIDFFQNLHISLYLSIFPYKYIYMYLSG